MWGVLGWTIVHSGRLGVHSGGLLFSPLGETIVHSGGLVCSFLLGVWQEVSPVIVIVFFLFLLVHKVKDSVRLKR